MTTTRNPDEPSTVAAWCVKYTPEIAVVSFCAGAVAGYHLAKRRIDQNRPDISIYGVSGLEQIRG